MTRRGAVWASLGSCGLAAVCCWQLIAAVLDGRHFQPHYSVVSAPTNDPNVFSESIGQTPTGHPTWIFASNFAGHLTPLLIATAALAAWLYYRFRISNTPMLVAVMLQALCAAGLAVIGFGALLDRNMTAAVAAMGAYPDSMRAGAGQELIVGVGALIAADLVSRAIRRSAAVQSHTDPAPTMTRWSLPGTHRQRLAVTGVAGVVILGGAAAVGASTMSAGPNPAIKAAEQRLFEGVVAEQTYWTNNGTFGTDKDAMTEVWSNINWVTGRSVSSGNNVLITLDPNSGGVVLTTAGPASRCYSLETINQPSSIESFYLEARTGTPSSPCSVPSPPDRPPRPGTRADRIIGHWATAW